MKRQNSNGDAKVAKLSSQHLGLGGYFFVMTIIKNNNILNVNLYFFISYCIINEKHRLLGGMRMNQHKISFRFYKDHEVREWYSQATFDEILDKYVEMNVAHLFM